MRESVSTYRRELTNGTIKEYTRKQKYKIKNVDYVQLTEEIKQKIIAWYETGVPATKIADKIGVSPYRIRTVIKKYKITGELSKISAIQSNDKS